MRQFHFFLIFSHFFFFQGSPDKISFVAEGTHGIEELKQHLSEDAFFYALIRVANPKELAHSVKTTYRDIFFAFQGPKVSNENVQKENLFLSSFLFSRFRS